MRFFTLLSLLLFANLSFSLGLGDADIKSNLGEKFLATVNVTDVEATPDAICFNASDIGDTAALKKVSVNLKSNNGNTTLVITSNNVVTEPIINLRVSFNCDPKFNRDYVLLLDPAPVSSEENAIISPDNTPAETTAISAEKKPKKSHQSNKRKTNTTESSELTVKVTPELDTIGAPIQKKKSKKNSSIDQKLLESYTGKQTTTAPTPSVEPNTANTNKSHPSADKPFLVISGGNTSANSGAEKPGISLRIATEIDVNRPDEVVNPQAATDAMDEVTVMTNRLAHLEKQIASLQARNAQLVSEAQKTKQESESFNWMLLLKIAAGIIVVLGLLELLRRKIVDRQTKATWFDAENSEASYKEPSNSNVTEHQDFDEKPTKLDVDNEHTFEDKVKSNYNTALTHASSFAVKEEQNSILEDADVFIEHGRPTLAIQLLQNYLIDAPTDSPAIWLKLLKLLSKEGSESDYDAAVVECNKHYNIKTPKYGNSPTEDTSSIEDYPHIVARLEGVWGTPYAVGFLNDLIFNKRSQPREGLNQNAFNDLFFLKTIAKNLELTDSSLFTSNPNASSQSNNNLTDVDLVTQNQNNLAASNIENKYVNDALFSDTENPNTTTSHSNLSDSGLGTKSDFGSFKDEASYEVNMLAEEESHLEVDNLSKSGLETEGLEFEAPEKNASDDEMLFKAEEINFKLPREKVEYASDAKVDVLNEEIVLAGDGEKSTSEKNNTLEFSLDFPDDMASKQQLTKEKSKTKNKSSAKNQPDSNEIEWDLPSIKPESDQ